MISTFDHLVCYEIEILSINPMVIKHLNEKSEVFA